MRNRMRLCAALLCCVLLCSCDGIVLGGKNVEELLRAPRPSQRQSAVQALAAVRGARQALQMGMTYDAVAVDIDAAVEALSELTGESASQQVIDTVFANFCVGK